VAAGASLEDEDLRRRETDVSNQRISIDANRALDLLREVVADIGADHVYRHPDGKPAAEVGEICRYEVNGSPACIVGHALNRAGVGVDALHEMDEYEDGAAIATVESDAVQIEPLARELLAVAQNKQDSGSTWGAALAAAEAQAGCEVGS
jgi:hypothetical protein